MDIKNEIQTRQIHRNGRPGTTHSRSLRVCNRHSKAPIPTQYPGDQLASLCSQIYAHTHKLRNSNIVATYAPALSRTRPPAPATGVCGYVRIDFNAFLVKFVCLCSVLFCFAFFVFSPFFMQFCCCQDQHRTSGLQQEE